MWSEAVYGVVLLGMAATLLLSLRGLRVLLSAWQSRRWPTASARITVAAILERHDEPGPCGYCPQVAYTFSVDGREYGGTRIAFGTEQLYGSPGFADAYDAILCVGKQVPVHYHPSTPTVSVLYPGIVRHSFLPFLRAMLGLTLLAVVLLALPAGMGVPPFLLPVFKAISGAAGNGAWIPPYQPGSPY